ncbi:Transcriptional regulatory protein ZraR [Anatilimnocola aggregata]|uniref:Transcriptional regulatory protein ZraR n=1 Tax=Anatilimnocola aggregata TaxID=2528021 RepID=A0A517Y9R7_9BACT|nr:sigma-54 dependent transcriptional regulator [Anatilimnocola aggregata]QDU26977.1 Transcriptional regulatory protein ZraR [Anatilimnocola aggregata]
MTQTNDEQQTGRVLVVDDNARARQSMADVLRHARHEVFACSSGREALQLLDTEAIDVVVTDLQMPGMTGLELIRALEARKFDGQVVMVTAFATVEAAVDAMRHGAFDFIEKPFDAEQLEQLVGRALRQGGRDHARSQILSAVPDWHGLMVGQSEPLATLRRRIAQVAPTDETVLITGESGTGKELVARCLHAASRRATGAFVGLNCPALSPQLMESELFGHEKGAFTSADAPRVGRFELADRGTILLDEITEIDMPLQAKLLRVLQEKTYERVGSSQSRTTNVRVIASTNRDLRLEVTQGRFRQDLYYRLAVVLLEVPPLRHRLSDVPLLVNHVAGQVAGRLNREPAQFSKSALDLLCHYHWPGNVRELENLVTRASVLASDQPISADDLQDWLLEGEPVAKSSLPAEANPLSAGTKLEDMERKLIEATLDHYDGHRAKAAQALGIGIRTLTNKLRLYGYAPRAKVFARVA